MTPSGGDFKEAVQDYIRFVDERGKKIVIVSENYSYNYPLAVKIYRKFRKRKVVAIIGFGGKDADILSPVLEVDKIPFITPMCSRISSYTFSINTHPTSQCKVALDWIKKNWEGKREPRVAFVSCDTLFGKSFWRDCIGFSGKIGVKVVYVEGIPIGDKDLDNYLKPLKDTKPDFIILNHTPEVSAAILRRAREIGINAQFVALSWSMDTELFELSGDASEGLVGLTSFEWWDGEGKGVELMRKISKRYHPYISKRSISYTKGIVAAMVVKKAIERTGRLISGEYIKASLETFRDFETGLSAPITFTRENHIGMRGVRIYQIKHGKLIPISDMIYID